MNNFDVIILVSQFSISKVISLLKKFQSSLSLSSSPFLLFVLYSSKFGSGNHSVMKQLIFSFNKNEKITVVENLRILEGRKLHIIDTRLRMNRDCDETTYK